jgi:streptogramin lyase
MAGTAQAQTLFNYQPMPAIQSAVAGPDGHIWFTSTAGQIGYTFPGGGTSVFSDQPSAGAAPDAIIVGPDGNYWFAEPGINSVGQVTPVGVITEYPVGVALQDMTVGPDGNIWFTAANAAGSNIVGKLALNGTATLYPLGTTPDQGVGAIRSGSDGNLWVVANLVPAIEKVSTAGKLLSTYALPGAVPPNGLTLGPDGALWFTGKSAGIVGRITPDGTATSFSAGITARGLEGIALGPDGNLWFAEEAPAIGRITPTGAVTEFLNYNPDGNFPAPDQPSVSRTMTAGPDKNSMWFDTANGYNGLVLADSSPLSASILPGGRTVVLGRPATVFATMVNSAPNALTNCQIAMPGGSNSGWQFTYQATDPTTNLPIGLPNQPVTLPANDGAQSFVLTIVGSNRAPAAASMIPVQFNCTNAYPPVLPRIDTLDLFFSNPDAGQAPDYIMVSASQTPGVLDVPVNGAAAFAVALANAGGAGSDSAIITANTGIAKLPLDITLCFTDPTSGACLQPPTPSLTWNPAAGATATLSVFVTATGPIPLLPIVNRVFVTADYTGAPAPARGSTSVAVEAQ